MKKLIILLSVLALTQSNSTGYVDLKGYVKNPGVYEIYENETIQDIINKSGGLKKNSYTDNINLSKLVKDEMVIYIHSKEVIQKQKELNNCDCSPIYKYIECDELEEEKGIKEEFKNTESTTSINVTTNGISTVPTTTTKLITTIEPITTKEKTTTKQTTKSTTSHKTSTTNDINKKININYCTIEELITLKGLGESKAKSIIEYRNTNGPFNSIEDILDVSGIGNKTFENIKDFIEV